MKLLIKNGEVVNPFGKNQGMLDILIADGVVAKMEKNIAESADETIDAKGLCVFPGFVDMHCHLREPGYEYKEDIYSGSRAALKGGFTTVACMPNTNPVIDTESVVDRVFVKAEEAGYIKVYPIAAVTKGSRGKELTEMGALVEAGCVGFSDDGRPVQNASMMRLALLYAKNFGALVISHCEDTDIQGDGVMNEGYYSSVLGLKGIPRAAEEVMAARDILLAESYGGRLHLAHVSTRGTVELVRQAKKRGVDMTAETCPHYFSADDSWVSLSDANTKVNPPLRTKDDVQAVIDGLKDGTIDAIVTDHAPHHADEKNVEFDKAAFGFTGFETAFSLCVAHLLGKALKKTDIVRLMSYNPAQRLGLPGGVIETGQQADITIADLNEKYVLKREDIISKGKNTPFIGQSLTGRVVHTISCGRHLFDNGEIKEI